MPALLINFWLSKMETHNEVPARPAIDYANLPHLAREGIQADGNYRYATRSLFLETAPEERKADAIWCLAEHEVYANGRWYPSAWMVYIEAVDEYDALRKLCGNVRQWEHIKAFLEKWKPGLLDAWVAEQAYIQRSRLRARLERGAMSGMPGYTAAAKMLLSMIDGPVKRGRPAKAKEPEKNDKEHAADAERVLQFRQ